MRACSGLPAYAGSAGVVGCPVGAWAAPHVLPVLWVFGMNNGDFTALHRCYLQSCALLQSDSLVIVMARGMTRSVGMDCCEGAEALLQARFLLV